MKACTFGHCFKKDRMKIDGVHFLESLAGLHLDDHSWKKKIIII